MSKDTIFVSIDVSFFELCLEFLKNIKSNYPSHPLIHICYTDLTDKHINKLKLANSNIKFIKNDIDDNIIGPIMTHLDKNKFNPKVFYARFMMWNEYFRQFDKILHLDVDIFINKPLDEIFEKEDFFIVREAYEGYDFKDLGDKELQKELINDNIKEIPQGSNAGIFLITKKYLNDEVINSFIDIKNRYERFIRFADQSIITIWMKKNHIISSDDYSFNYQFRLFFIKPKNIKEINEAKIIHLNGLSKSCKIFLLRIFNFGFFRLFVYINGITNGLISKIIF